MCTLDRTHSYHRVNMHCSPVEILTEVGPGSPALDSLAWAFPFTSVISCLFILDPTVNVHRHRPGIQCWVISSEMLHVGSSLKFNFRETWNISRLKGWESWIFTVEWNHKGARFSIPSAGHLWSWRFCDLFVIAVSRQSLLVIPSSPIYCTTWSPALNRGATIVWQKSIIGFHIISCSQQGTTIVWLNSIIRLHFTYVIPHFDK